jgi:[acyl-carrier-protein] S-malonyltransferase
MEAENAVWLFPGQGSQFVGMGWELLREFPPAAEILELASGLCGADLQELCLRGPESSLGRTDRLQPALTAISLGCSQLLMSRGYRPGAVAGHSLGEFAALYAAGVLSAEETLHLASERGRLMHEAAQRVQGGMLAVRDLAAPRVEQVAADLQDRFAITVANYNSPRQIVLSGEPQALERARAAVLRQGGTARPLNVSGPWHSSLLRQAERRFAACIDEVSFRDPSVPVFLGVTGTPCRSGRAIRAVMGRQMCSPVHWTRVVEEMVRIGAARFIEVGPGKVLRGLLRETLAEAGAYPTVGFAGPKDLRFLQGPATGAGV